MNILQQHKKEIMNEWNESVRNRIPAAKDQSQLALYDSLPDFIENLGKLIFSQNLMEVEAASIKEDLIGKVHGQHRANNSYAIDQMIDEYFILKEIILKYLKQNGSLDVGTCEIVSDSFQKAIQKSASQFSKSLLDSQERFILAMAHDIRNPLTNIQMQAQFMKKTALYSDEVCERISNSVKKVDDLIVNLLDTIKTQSSHHTFLDTEEFDLKVLVKKVFHDFENIYPDTLKLDAETTFVKWNQMAMERVLDNLISNAIKYGDMSRPVSVAIKQDESNVFLSVHNHGDPIPPEEQIHLFQKFKRAQGTDQKTGWGIGLSYVKSVIEEHKGIVLVHSDKGGTTFKFEIPKNMEMASLHSIEASQEVSQL